MIDNLSVFLPTFNEEGNIKAAVAKVVSVLKKVVGKWELIIVDDGSTDDTSKIADELAGADRRIRVIHHGVNRGYGGALKTGFENAKYSWVSFMDSDRQFDFSEIEKFIVKKNEADLILGYRLKRADSLARKIFTFGWSTLARLMLGLKARDYSCGFKMIKKKVYEDIQPLVGEEKVTQIEMLVKARKMGFKFAQVGVNHFPRISGKPTGAKLKVVIKSLYDLLGLWRRLHKISKQELLIIFVILAVGAFLRLYRIGDYMTFLGDEGRDAIIVRRLLVNFDPILIGPGTSIGGMYLGPLYYYLIAPFLFLANFSPVGPSVFVAWVGVATIWLVYHVGKEWFSEKAGLIASALYAVSPIVIIYSRSSWNPNIIPFFALLSVYSIWKVFKSREASREVGWWLIVLGISFAFVLQSHYLGFLLAPTLFLFWYLRRPPIRYTLYAITIFLFLMSPLVIFDTRHGWNNFSAMKKFFGQRQTTVSARPWNAIPKMYPIYSDMNTSLLTAKNAAVGKWLTFGIVVSLVYLFAFRKFSLDSRFYLLAFWMGFGLLGLGLYKQQIYDHYYGFMFPAAFLLFGYLVSLLVKKSSAYYLVPIVLILFSLAVTPIKSPPNMQMQRAIEVSKKISEEAKGQSFNIAVVAERNYEDGYQYFLEKDGQPVIEIDAQIEETVTNQLFVICEMVPEKCDPTHSSKAEVANFGWSKIENQWEVFGARLYKLGHTK